MEVEKRYYEETYFKIMDRWLIKPAYFYMLIILATSGWFALVFLTPAFLPEVNAFPSMYLADLLFPLTIGITCLIIFVMTFLFLLISLFIDLDNKLQSGSVKKVKVYSFVTEPQVIYKPVKVEKPKKIVVENVIRTKSYDDLEALVLDKTE